VCVCVCACMSVIAAVLVLLLCWCLQEGKLATGIMTHIAKNAGYQSVSDFLDKGVGEMANMLRWKSPPVPPPPRTKPRSPGGRPRLYGVQGEDLPSGSWAGWHAGWCCYSPTVLICRIVILN